jgi:hypothetical protein
MTAISADGSFSVDARGGEGGVNVVGPLTAKARFATTQSAVGEATLEGRLAGRSAVFDKIVLSGAGGESAGGLGKAAGNATIDFDDPNRSTAALAWQDVDGRRLADIVPALDGLSGRYSGELAVAPSSDVRAIEPLRLTIGLTPSDGRFRTVEIGPAKLSLFANVTPSFQLRRLVMDELPSENLATLAREKELDARQPSLPASERPLTWNDFRIAGGRLKLWARRGRPGGSQGEIQTHFTGTFTRLDFDQLIHVFKPQADAMPGKISGNFVIHGDPRDRDAVFGDGHLRIADSDLAKADALALLYDLLGLGTAPKEPIGAGSVDLSLQRSTLTLDNLRYLNRGVEVWSSGLAMDDVWRLPHNPIHGYVVGSARPLSALKIPLLADVDQIMSVLQSNLTTVKISGTVEEPKVESATFSDLGEGFKMFMKGEVDENAR